MLKLNTSVTILFVTTQHRYLFFCKYNAQNLVWNWYGSMEDCLPFHSILASSIFHTEISVPFHFLFHSIPCPGDRGVQFTSHLWKELCKFLGCKLVHTTAFHPESNGFLERQHRTLRAALKSQENPRDWFSNLGFVLLGIRSSPKSDFEVSSAQLCLGTSQRLPGQFFEPSFETPQTEYCAQLCQFMSTLRAAPPHHHGTPRSYVEKALQTCTHVFVKNDTARSSFD